MAIYDTEKLRNDLIDDCMAAFFGAGIGGALFEADDIKRASEEELIKMAKNNGFNLRKYEK